MSGSKPHQHQRDADALQVVNSAEQVELAQNVIVDAAARHNYPKSSLFALRLALQEAISNAFRHGHRNLPATTPIRVEFEVSDAAVRVAIEDQGPGFDPSLIPDPTLEPNLEATSGRGLFLMRAYMESLSYNARGNRLEMIYRHPALGLPGTP